MIHNHRSQMLYQKTSFNNHKICQLSGIFKCCKCKKNNMIVVDINHKAQMCLFCGMPNNVKNNINVIKNIR